MTSIRHRLTKGALLLLTTILICPSPAHAENKEFSTPAPAGTPLCLLNSKGLQSLKVEKSIFQRIYARIANSLGQKPDQSGAIAWDLVDKKLREKVGDENGAIRLSLKPDGQITNLEIIEGYGSKEAAKLAMDTLMKARPFPAYKTSKIMAYRIEFPHLQVKPFFPNRL